MSTQRETLHKAPDVMLVMMMVLSLVGIAVKVRRMMEGCAGSLSCGIALVLA